MGTDNDPCGGDLGSHLDRRALIRRAGVGAALVWAVPVVAAVPASAAGTPAAGLAAGTPQPVCTLDPNEPYGFVIELQAVGVPAGAFYQIQIQPPLGPTVATGLVPANGIIVFSFAAASPIGPTQFLAQVADTPSFPPTVVYAQTTFTAETPSICPPP